MSGKLVLNNNLLIQLFHCKGYNQLNKINTHNFVKGMGELHLEVIYERLRSEFKVEADLGKLQVAYKETITTPNSKRSVFERRLADRKHQVIIELEIVPEENIPFPKVRLGTGKDTLDNLRHVTERQLRLIQNGTESALRCGPKLGFPVRYSTMSSSRPIFQSSHGDSFPR